jgi:leader peptidase (prepilin peptidase) / N-methyltransferase
MTEVSVSVAPPESDPATADETNVVKPQSRPLAELLPRGGRAALVIAVSAALVAAGFARYGATGWALVGLVFLPVLVLLASIDFQHRLLPNRIVLPAALIVGIIVAVSQPHDFVAHFAAGFGFGALFFAIGAFFPGSIGMGDAKLCLLLGLALGSKTIAALEIALLGVLVVALWMIVTQGMSARKQTIAFGPFLALGGIVAFFLA